MEELVKALKTIKTMCKNRDDCEECLLGNSPWECPFETPPSVWMVLEKPNSEGKIIRY